MKHQTVGLQFDFQKSKRAKPWKTVFEMSYASQIDYSDKYYDATYEYR